ncbi:hypothetical protein B0H13DRAFT_2336336 [Mycena leptocephala]|nr:hypothetical protein B0H13DRAFT_2336336 [Mycena leptocephala]
MPHPDWRLSLRIRLSVMHHSPTPPCPSFIACTNETILESVRWPQIYALVGASRPDSVAWKRWSEAQNQIGAEDVWWEEEGTGEKVEGEEIGDRTYLSRSKVPCIAKTDGWSPTVNEDPAHVHVNESRMRMRRSRKPSLSLPCPRPTTAVSAYPSLCVDSIARASGLRTLTVERCALRNINALVLQALEPIALASRVLLCSITYHPADLASPQEDPPILYTRDDHALSPPNPRGSDVPFPTTAVATGSGHDVRLKAPTSYH